MTQENKICDDARQFMKFMFPNLGVGTFDCVWVNGGFREVDLVRGILRNEKKMGIFNVS